MISYYQLTTMDAAWRDAGKAWHDASNAVMVALCTNDAAARAKAIEDYDAAKMLHAAAHERYLAAKEGREVALAVGEVP